MCLFTGETKSGKTTAWSSFPEPIYCFDLDGRMAPLASNPLTKNRDIEFDTYFDFVKVMEKLEELQKNHSPYKTIVFDSLTSLARLVIGFIFENRGATAELSKATEKQRERGSLKIGGIPVMGISDYNGESSALNAVLLKLRIIHNHGVNCILTAHVVVTESPTLDGGSRTSRRIVTGGNKVASEVPGYFDEVYHFMYKLPPGLSDAGGRYVARTKPTNTDNAGTSMQGIPDEIDFTNLLFYQELSKYFPKVTE
jgi:hypothetical protein